MGGDFGNDFITVTDDEGNKFELEHLDTIEMNGQLYVAFLPADLAETDEDFGMIVLKVVEEDNEDFLVTVDDDDELDMAFARFFERLDDDD